MKPKFDVGDWVASIHNPRHAFKIVDILVGSTEVFYYDSNYCVYTETVLIKVT